MIKSAYIVHWAKVWEMKLLGACNNTLSEAEEYYIYMIKSAYIVHRAKVWEMKLLGACKNTLSEAEEYYYIYDKVSLYSP